MGTIDDDVNIGSCDGDKGRRKGAGWFHVE